jgi:hypothetical protein
MRTIVCIGLLAAGCATEKAALRSESELQCGIAPLGWPSASRDFDRYRTLTTIALLNDATRRDREQLHAGEKAHVGAVLDTALRQPESVGGPFVSQGVAELGIRLRQLDCAVRGDRLAFQLADRLYGQILAELGAEQTTLEPVAGAPRTAAP